MQICKENILKVATVFLYTNPERDGDVSTNTIEDVSMQHVFITHKALQIEDVTYVRIKFLKRVEDLARRGRFYTVLIRV